jgi:GDPmannose 4,6-dehydratase
MGARAATRGGTALVCGVSGQDGAYLARLLLDKGYRVVGASRDAHTSSFSNLRRLGVLDRIETLSMAQTDFRSVLEALVRTEPDEVYNLAGQSSVGLSFQQPVETLESVALGSLNLLEAIRFIGRPTRMYNAGSGECFGDTGGVPVNETAAFRPRSPYATAKAAAHWTIANYRDAYGLFACSGILFNHESPLRPRRFVTRKVVSGACAIAAGEATELELGDLSVCRDWGWAPEYVEAMWLMLQQDQPDDFVIATGRSHSLREFCEAAFTAVGLRLDDHLKVNRELFRPSEILANSGDASKAEAMLGWRARTLMPEVVARMVADELALRAQAGATR